MTFHTFVSVDPHAFLTSDLFTNITKEKGRVIEAYIDVRLPCIVRKDGTDTWTRPTDFSRTVGSNCRALMLYATGLDSFLDPQYPSKRRNKDRFQVETRQGNMIFGHMSDTVAGEISYNFDRFFPHFLLERKINNLLPGGQSNLIQSSTAGNTMAVFYWQNNEVKNIYQIETRLNIGRLNTEDGVRFKTDVYIKVYKFRVTRPRANALLLVTSLIRRLENEDDVEDPTDENASESSREDDNNEDDNANNGDDMELLNADRRLAELRFDT
jgi:hypothetical protein